MSFQPVRMIAVLAGACAMASCANPSIANEAGQDAPHLLTALDDEYRAEATYAAVLEEYGSVRPFVNIIEAERRHAMRAKSEMDRLGIAYPKANPYLGKIAAPASLLAACEQGVSAEIENIVLYDRILPKVRDDSVRATLEDLQWASRERHLPAFERCVARGGTMGQGPGHGGGGMGHGGGHGPGSF